MKEWFQDMQGYQDQVQAQLEALVRQRQIRAMNGEIEVGGQPIAPPREQLASQLYEVWSSAHKGIDSKGIPLQPWNQLHMYEPHEADAWLQVADFIIALETRPHARLGDAPRGGGPNPTVSSHCEVEPQNYTHNKLLQETNNRRNTRGLLPDGSLLMTEVIDRTEVASNTIDI